MAGFKIIIPARYASSRFPGKPLALIAGQPMIAHVWQRAIEAADSRDDVFVATDDPRIQAVVEGFGGQVVMTGTNHETGTDRLCEVVERLSLEDSDIIVNIQGDEPLIDPALVTLVARTLAAHPEAAIATAADPITNIADVSNHNIVKLVTDKAGFALYFSRAAIPHVREPGENRHIAFPYQRHIGIYAYRAKTLRLWPSLALAPIEQAEKLEQLRAMWHGLKISVAPYEGPRAVGVDTPEDIALVEARLREIVSENPETKLGPAR